MLHNAMQTVRRDEVRQRTYDERESRRGEVGARSSKSRRFTEYGNKRLSHHTRRSSSPRRRRKTRRDRRNSPPRSSSDDEYITNDLHTEAAQQSVIGQQDTDDQQIEDAQWDETDHQDGIVQWVNTSQWTEANQQVEADHQVEDHHEEVNPAEDLTDYAMIMDDEALLAQGAEGGGNDLGLGEIAEDGHVEGQ